MPQWVHSKAVQEKLGHLYHRAIRPAIRLVRLALTTPQVVVENRHDSPAMTRFANVDFFVLFFAGKVAATPANNSKSETTTSKEKSSRSKGKSQTLAAGSTGQSDEAAAKTNGSTRKIKEKTTSGNGSAITGNGSGTVGHSQQERATLKQQERQRSTSRSPALSSSSNPTPPPTSTSPTPPPTSQESGFPSTVQQHHSILQQGASLAAEEEEIDRARDEAEDIGKPKQISTEHSVLLTGSSANQACSAEVLTPVPVPVAASSSYGHTHSILDNGSNNHSFFSTGPLPAYTARTTGTAASACWFFFPTFCFCFDC